MCYIYHTTLLLSGRVPEGTEGFSLAGEQPDGQFLSCYLFIQRLLGTVKSTQVAHSHFIRKLASEASHLIGKSASKASHFIGKFTPTKKHLYRTPFDDLPMSVNSFDTSISPVKQQQKLLSSP